MRRAKLAECLPGDWVFFLDTEDLIVEDDSASEVWSAPDGSAWTFRLKEVPVEGGTLFGWVRE